MVKNNKDQIQIFIAESHEIVRSGLKTILDQQDDFEVIGVAACCEKILAQKSALQPSLILLDLSLKDDSELHFINKLARSYPSCKVLVYTVSTNMDFHLLALRYGAVGILYKSESAGLLCKAIRRVCTHNEIWVGKNLVAEMWKQNIQNSASLTTGSTKTSRADKHNRADSLDITLASTLTPRERQIACLSSKGLTAKKIGEGLFICEKTVRNQLTIIYSKLHVKNQIELTINSSLLNLGEE